MRNQKTGFNRRHLRLFLFAPLILAFALLLLALPVEGTSAQFDEKSWDFERFDVDIQLHEDASFTVRETQVVNFQGSFSFLTRDIDTGTASFSEGRTYGRVRVKDIQVYDLDGQPYDGELWSTENYDGGVTVTINFEAQDEQRGWIIEYRMTGAIIFAEDYDRFYWNAVSEYREVPIKSSLVTAYLPPQTDMDQVETAFYTEYAYAAENTDYGRDGDMLWWYAENIAPYTTITIDVAFPKGIVEKPWQYRGITGLIVIIFSAVFFITTLVIMLLLWWIRGRDVGGTDSAMVQYEPPEGLRPAMMGMLVNELPRVDDISATIVDLARRGKLSIFEQEAGGVFQRVKYGFQRTDEDESDLLTYEREIMKGLFEKGNRVTEDDLRNEFYTHIGEILNQGVKQEVMKRGLFIKDPQKVREGYYWKGALLAIVPAAVIFSLNIWLDMGYLNLLAAGFIPSGITIAVIGRFMPRRSSKGSQVYEHALGFKEYMATAESEEMKYMTPENFQKNLPYAMVMGVADKWGEKFADIYTTPPEWYHGTHTGFNTVYFTSSLSNMNHSLNRTLSSSPSSSGSGGGGGGFGGGSSGGGFGGGGSSAG
jgi:uncharacterized membrane protein YgcG